MNVYISGDISNEDDVIVSLGHSSRGVYQNVTKYLVYELSKKESMEEEGDMEEYMAEHIEEDGSMKEGRSLWKLDITLPFPHSQASGNLTLSVGDSHSGDVATTRLIIKQDGKEMAPFFDPIPKSVKTYPGQDVLIYTIASGSTPISVRLFNPSITDYLLYYIIFIPY